MSEDFAGLLDDVVYETFAIEAEITPVGGTLLKIDALTKIEEVFEEVGEAGVGTPTLRPILDLQLSDLLAAGLSRADLEKAEVVFAGVRHRVLATQPAKNLRDIRLILIEEA